MKTFHVEYSSNNSGGSWWLKDGDWKNLEKEGWRVHWEADRPADAWFSGDVKKTGRWLGALATNACKDFEATSEGDAENKAISEFESITGQDYWSRGCSCCGNPHYMSVGHTKTGCNCTYYYPELKEDG